MTHPVTRRRPAAHPVAERTLDKATREQLWMDPDWTCSRCKSVNLAIRSACRICGYVGGEVLIIEAVCLEVSDD